MNLVCMYFHMSHANVSGKEIKWRHLNRKCAIHIIFQESESGNIGKSQWTAQMTQILSEESLLQYMRNMKDSIFCTESLKETHETKQNPIFDLSYVT